MHLGDMEVEYSHDLNQEINNSTKKATSQIQYKTREQQTSFTEKKYISNQLKQY